MCVTLQFTENRKSQLFWMAEVLRICSTQDPKLDAAGALADLLVFSLNLTGLDILQKIESQDSTWQVTCTSRMADCLSGFIALFRNAKLCCNACDLCRWNYRLMFKDLWHADKKQDRNALAKPLQNILQEVEGSPVVKTKTKVLHLFRYANIMITIFSAQNLCSSCNCT